MHMFLLCYICSVVDTKKKKNSYSYVQGTMSGINIFYLKPQTPLNQSSIVLTLKMKRLWGS